MITIKIVIEILTRLMLSERRVTIRTDLRKCIDLLERYRIENL